MWGWVVTIRRLGIVVFKGPDPHNFTLRRSEV